MNNIEKTRSLGDKEIERLEREIIKKLTPSQRIQATIELSDFIGRLTVAAKRTGKIRRRYLNKK